MKLKALGAVVALLAVCVASAQVSSTRVITRGLATGENGSRVFFNATFAEIQQGSNIRYLGFASFRWSDNNLAYNLNMRRLTSLSIDSSDPDFTIIEATGLAELTRGGMWFNSRTPRTLGVVSIRIVKRNTPNEENPDILEFSFVPTSGEQYHFSGTSQSGFQFFSLTN